MYHSWVEISRYFTIFLRMFLTWLCCRQLQSNREGEDWRKTCSHMTSPRLRIIFSLHAACWGGRAGSMFLAEFVGRHTIAASRFPSELQTMAKTSTSGLSTFCQTIPRRLDCWRVTRVIVFFSTSSFPWQG